MTDSSTRTGSTIPQPPISTLRLTSALAGMLRGRGVIARNAMRSAAISLSGSVYESFFSMIVVF